MSNVQHDGLTGSELHVPKVHKDSHVDGTDDIQDATSGQKGLATAAQITQLDGAVLESDIKDQSFTNLLKNGDFESWSAGTAAAPDGWITSGTAPTIAKELTTFKIGTASVKLTANNSNSAIVGSADEYIRYRSRVVTAGCWIHSTHAGAKLFIVDGSGFYDVAHSGGGGWEFITKTITVDAAASSLEVHVTPDNVGGTGFAYFDGAILVEGSVCPAFSPKPLVDDGRTVAIDSATNKLTLGNLLVCTPSSDTTITAAGGITVANTIMRVVGDSGAIDITANPQIVAGSDGQIVIIQGTHDTNTVKLDNGTGLALSASITLAKNDNITLVYDSGESVWIETSRTTVA